MPEKAVLALVDVEGFEFAPVFYPVHGLSGFFFRSVSLLPDAAGVSLCLLFFGEKVEE